MPKKDAPCKVTCTNPKGKTTELPVKKSPEGYTTSLTPTEPGPHKVSVDFDKKPVPKSPFTVDVQPKGAKPSKAEPGKSEITVKGLDTRKFPFDVMEVRNQSCLTFLHTEIISQKTLFDYEYFLPLLFDMP